MKNIPVGTVGAVSQSQRGQVICVFHEAAYTGQHQSILSSFQMEHHGLQVEDKNPAVGGLGRIETPDGYTFPLSYKSGLAYLKMQPFTTTEWKTLPHVMMTSDKAWDPTVFDVDVDPTSTCFLASHPEQLHKLPTPDFNMLGEFIRVKKLLQNGTIEFDEFISGELFEDAIQEEDNIDDTEDSFQFWMQDEDYLHQQTISRCMYASRNIIDESDILLAFELEINDSPIINGMQPREHTPSDIDFESMQPYFSWITTDVIKKTFQNSTQY